MYLPIYRGFPGGSDDKASTHNAGHPFRVLDLTYKKENLKIKNYIWETLRSHESLNLSNSLYKTMAWQRLGS